jgi:hypothetical protein
MNGPLLGKGHRTRLRTRRRWVTCAYVLAALGVGYVLLHVLSPSTFASTTEDEHGLGGRLEGLMPTAIPGMGYIASKGKGKASSKGSSQGKGKDQGRGKAKAMNSTPHDHSSTNTFQSHKWRPDGLLEVNPKGRHPIFDLIEHAEKEWQTKIARQSKSLDEAVAEYRRRYGRSPPRGFDRW